MFPKPTMTKFGVGPQFTLLSVGYGLFTIVLHSYVPLSFENHLIPRAFLIVLGIVLILMGIPFYLNALTTVMRAFDKGELVTKGAFGMCRHPVYASWVLFFVPGIVLLTDAFIGITLPVFMYILLRRLVKDEESYLANKFGSTYTCYHKKVPAVLPVGWITFKAVS